MAYFSNGLEGESWAVTECGNCVLGIDSPCPIYQAHFLYNYDAIGNKIAESILNHLVPMIDDMWAGECAMRLLLDKTVGKKPDGDSHDRLQHSL